ncbi:MAG: NAD-dependent malic enzyme [Firmicutes bacterium]|nr:NAD-dependent malic enzyme [Bacillota bacterium]
MDIRETALKLHKDNQGKIAVISKVPLKNQRDLSLAYTPGVAEPCKEIRDNPATVYDYTARSNLVAVVSDGTAVLGLGNIGPMAALPVMEGKALLFKAFAGVDAFPICLGTTDIDEIVRTVKLLEPTFGGVNLEDIAAPNCFEIERRLKEICDIPIFHDDQHGTAIVVLAAVINALKVVKKSLDQVKLVINGAGSAGIAITKLLLKAGLKHVIMCDKPGAIYEGADWLNPAQAEMARITNQEKYTGTLAEVLTGADIFIGVSAAGVVTREMVATMAPSAIVLAMANPVPEIMPEEAKAGGAMVVGTGRSDFPNQVNNVLAFPGVFRGALDVRARDINDEMKLAAAHAIAQLIKDEELNPEYIIPKPFDPRVAPAVAAAVAQAAIESGVARMTVEPQEIALRTKRLAAI